MQFKAWNGPRQDLKTCIVLGAGASRGASFVRGARRVRPPLDCDFFSELQRLKQTNEVRSLLRFVRNQFGIGLTLSMENFFSQIESMSSFHEDIKIDRGPIIRRYQKAGEWFYRSLPILFKESIDDNSCEYHKDLVQNLQAGDVIFSFNYDCLIDAALRDKGQNNWNAKRGYGFEVNQGHLFWQKKARGGGIKLLKMHGSLHWKIKNDPKKSGEKLVDLLEKPYDIESAEKKIIPPTWFKSLGEKPYKNVWRSARKEIRGCRALIVIGYSLPVTDLFSHALFKADVRSKIKQEKLKFLVLVNPDKFARRRFVDLVEHRIEATTRILEFDCLKELADSLSP